MIGVTALALAAVAALVAAAIMLVWATGFAVFYGFEPMVGPAWAAAIVVGVDLLAMLLGFGIARLRHHIKEHKEEIEQQQQKDESPSLVGLFADAIKDRPITALLVSAVTGFVAVKNPKIFRDLVSDVLRGGKG